MTPSFPTRRSSDLVGDGGPRQIFSSRVAIRRSGAVSASYDKFHLVPCGEYVPFRRFLPIAKITAGQMDFSPGPGPRTLTIPGAPPFSPLICYEAIFPGAVVDRGERPAWMLNVTNDSWYGRTAGPHQHRSEEHTSELQSLMRISYAVF